MSDHIYWFDPICLHFNWKPYFFKLWFKWIVFHSDRCIGFLTVGTLKKIPLGRFHLEAQTTTLRLFIVLLPSIKFSFESSKHVEDYFIKKVWIIKNCVLYTCWYEVGINFHLIFLYISKYVAGVVIIDNFQLKESNHQMLSLLCKVFFQITISLRKRRSTVDFPNIFQVNIYFNLTCS